jgi:tetratricopeptide (TPR) repeat protein
MKMLNAPYLKTFSAAFALALCTAIFPGVSALAQGTSVRGHVQNAAGQPFTSGEVKFTTEKTTPTAELKFPANRVFAIDGSGNYTATGLPPGDYFVFFYQGGKLADREELTIKASDTSVKLDDDETRPEFINALTPEEKKALEEYKKNNAATTANNAVIANLNNTLKTVRADLAAAAPTKADVSTDVTNMKAAVDAKPDEGLLWLNYGDTLSAEGDHMASDDKKAGKPAITDDAVLKEYSDAVDAYKKSIALDTASKKPSPASQAAAYNQMGNALARSGKVDDAGAAFENAVKAEPARAGMYYKNEAAIFYNAGQNDAAETAAEKAIAADPKLADAYFIKGQALVTKSTFDNKTQKLVRRCVSNVPAAGPRRSEGRTSKGSAGQPW